MSGKYQNAYTLTATGKKNYTAPAQWVTLLERVLTDPGVISKAYSTFYNYSMGNAMMAMTQLAARGLEIGPLASYARWQELGRQVRKGETALVMLQPRRYKFTKENADGEEEEHQFQRFIYLPTAFAYAQTDPIEGKEDRSAELRTGPDGWRQMVALEELGITLAPFTDTNGNVQGYFSPTARTIHINPVAAHAQKTLLHEMAHAVLHEKGYVGCESRGIAEVEAEATAMIVADALNIEGADESRGYIQHWMKQAGAEEITEKVANRIFSASERILKAGRAAKQIQNEHAATVAA